MPPPEITFRQALNPFEHAFAGSAFWSTAISTAIAALPVIALFYFLVPRRWLASKAGAAGAIVAIGLAIVAYRMPWDMTLWSFGYGAAFGLLPVGWTIFAAMLLYNITVETGQFQVIKQSIAGLSGDARIQAVLIGFSFGAFLEAAAGGGTPVAICGAIMVGLGFNPFLAAVLCLIANTSPVAYGGLGTPILVLSGVTQLPGEAISTMAGHQLPFLSFIVPLWMVKCMCSWKQTWEIWPVLLVSGLSFAIFQYFFATFHDWVPGVVLYPMTDIGGGIFSLVVTAIFLRATGSQRRNGTSTRRRRQAARPQRRLTRTTPTLPRPPHSWGSATRRRDSTSHGGQRHPRLDAVYLDVDPAHGHRCRPPKGKNVRSGPWRRLHPGHGDRHQLQRPRSHASRDGWFAILISNQNNAPNEPSSTSHGSPRRARPCSSPASFQ